MTALLRPGEQHGLELWRLQASCAVDGQIEPSFHNPKDEQSVVAAKEICAQCVVREECLDYALLNQSVMAKSAKEKIWGGMTFHERASEAAKRITDRDGVMANQREVRNALRVYYPWIAR